MTLNSSGPARVATAAATTLSGAVRGLAADLIGLGFGGVAIYGFATGRMAPAALTTATALAALYLGLKVPSSISSSG